MLLQAASCRWGNRHRDIEHLTQVAQLAREDLEHFPADHSASCMPRPRVCPKGLRRQDGMLTVGCQPTLS